MFKSKPLPVILFTVFLDLVGIGILFPLIPVLLADPTSPSYLLPPSMSIGTGYLILGLLVAIYPLMIFISAPVLGQVSDRYGRRRVLALCILGNVIGYFIFALAIISRNIPLLFVSRAISGITGGNLAVAQAIMADITPPQGRAKAFGLIGAAFGAGFIVGPFLGGKLSDPTLVSWFTAATPFFFASALSLINLTLVLLLLPETYKPAHHFALQWNRSLSNIKEAFTHPDLRTLFTVAFIFQCGFSFFVTFFGVFLIDRLGMSQGQIGDFFAYIGLWVIIAQAIIVRLAARWFKEHQVLQVSLLAAGVSLLLYYFVQTPLQLFLVTPLFAIFNGLTQANLVGLVSENAGPNVQGRVLGINASIQSLAQALPPIVAGVIAANLTPESPVIVAAIVTVIAGVVFILTFKPGIKPLKAHGPKAD